MGPLLVVLGPPGSEVQRCCWLSEGSKPQYLWTLSYREPMCVFSYKAKSLSSSSLKLKPDAAVLEVCTWLDTAWPTGVTGRQNRATWRWRMKACTEEMMCGVHVFMTKHPVICRCHRSREFLVTFKFCAFLQPTQKHSLHVSGYDGRLMHDVKEV